MTSIHLISVVSLALVFVFGVITLSVRFFEIDIFYNEAQPLEYIYIMFQNITLEWHVSLNLADLCEKEF